MNELTKAIIAHIETQVGTALHATQNALEGLPSAPLTDDGPEIHLLEASNYLALAGVALRTAIGETKR